jgi:glycosyltransferase involved in cell wall biosynthesis
MKFAFLSHVLPPSWSGQAVMIERILRQIPASDYCLLSCENYNAGFGEGEFIRRLPARYSHIPSHHRFPILRTSATKWASVLTEIFRRAALISRIIKAENCTALIAGSGDVMDIPAACIAGHLSGVSFYPYLFDDYAYQWSDPAIRSITHRLEPVIMKRAKGIIVPNEFMREEIIRRHGIVPAIVRNPCESDSVEVYERENLDLDSRACTITFTGAVYDVNFGAFRNLIAALEYLNIYGAAVHIYTAQPRDFLENAGIVGPKAVYHQHVPPEQVIEAQNTADILFIPFAFDSLIPEVIKTSSPGKLGDYLASGTPILAHVPPNSFVSWYLKRHHCGVVVDDDDPHALSVAVQRLSSDIELRRIISRNARKRAMDDFVPKTAMRNFLAALEAD